MRLAVLDCETWLRGPGGGAPPLVCFGWARFEGGILLDKGLVTHKGEFTEVPGTLVAGGLVDPSQVVRDLFAWVRETYGVFANHHIPFDFSALCHFDNSLIEDVFAMYDDRLVEDTTLRESLMDIAAGSLGFWRDGRRTAAGKQVKKKYALDSLVEFYFGREMSGKNTVRLGYHGLHNVPLADWTDEERDYPVDDTVETGLLYFAQQADVAEDKEDGKIPNSPQQARTHWALYLSTLWGIRTDKKRVQLFKHELEVTFKVLTRALECVGFVRSAEEKGKTGSKNMGEIKRAILGLADACGFEPLLTDAAEKDKVTAHTLKDTEDPLKYLSTSKEAISDLTEAAGFGLGSIDEGEEGEDDGDSEMSPLALGLLLAKSLIEEMGEKEVTQETKERSLPLVPLHMSVQKLLKTYVPVLESGFYNCINPECRPLMATGRVSYAKPNLTNLPRAPGVRECFIARPGYTLCTVDYEALELHTLAQVCLNLVGHSRLADVLNSGMDPHLLFATDHFLKDVSYEEGKLIRKDEAHPMHCQVVGARDRAKGGNFGYPGGLGAAKFVKYLKGSGITITLEEAKEIKRLWLLQWPEMRDYFRYINSLTYVDDDGDEYISIEQLYSGRVRGRMRYPAACNTTFQGLAADGAKEAVYRLQRECYFPGGSLYGSRLLVFPHDETIMEHPIESAHERAFIQRDIMVNTMHEFTPDVRPKAEPALMHRWYKGAAERYDENGRLVEWEPLETST